MAKSNIILKRPVNKLFTVKNTYCGTNQTDKAREKNSTIPVPIPDGQKKLS